MHPHQRAHSLARLVLAWFALALVVAIASPIVNPQALELVCASGSMKLVQLPDDDGGTPGTAHALDCPMCAPTGAPPPLHAQLPAVQPLGHAVRSIPAARIAGILAAALPARGPPSPLST